MASFLRLGEICEPPRRSVRRRGRIARTSMIPLIHRCLGTRSPTSGRNKEGALSTVVAVLAFGVWQISLIAVWLLVLALAFLLAGALRQIGLIQLRLGDDPGALITDFGLDRGTLAPDFEALDVEGEAVRLSDLSPQPRLLIFLTPSCLACRALMPSINEVYETRSDEFDFLVFCRGDLHSCRALARMNDLAARMLVDHTGEVEARYEVAATPFAYLLDADRRVLIRGIANDWRQLESLLEQEGTLQVGRPLIPAANQGKVADLAREGAVP